MIYTFCPKCGHRYAPDQIEREALYCAHCRFTFYLNSKPTVSLLVVRDNALLLGKRKIEPSKGMWDVIGGFLNFGEHPIEGAKREAKEETGLDIDPHTLLGFFMDTYGPTQDKTLNICFIGKVIGGELKADDDIEELRWFSVDEIPSEIAFKNGRDMIDAWLQTRKSSDNRY